jgi:hypothetical protein
MFNRTSLNEAIINGDSGNPIFLILNGKPVIIGCFTWGGAGSGNSLTYYANLTNGGVQPEQNINDLIKATDAIAGINTGYKISLFDFSTTALQTQNSSNEINIRIVDNNLIVDIESININSSIQITDILGKVVLFKKLSNQHTEIFLNKNGVCFITIKNGNKTMTTKLMTK